MRTQSTQFLSMNRLPKQSLLVYSKNTGEGYKQAGMDSFNDITISRPEYDQEYKCNTASAGVIRKCDGLLIDELYSETFGENIQMYSIRLYTK